MVNHLGGTARDEIKCHEGVKSDYKSLVKLLHKHFGAIETTQSLQRSFYEHNQAEGESLMDFSRALIRLYDIILDVASDSERESLKGLGDRVLIGQFVAGARNQSMRIELRRLELAKPDQKFGEMRDAALDHFREIERDPPTRRSHIRGGMG